MGEYHSGITLGQAGEFDKERVRHALAGELMCGEDENGFVYKSAPKEECDAFILDVVDNWVFESKRLADSGRAIERIMNRHGFQMDFHEYLIEMHSAEVEHAGDYLFENQRKELEDEIDQIEQS